MATTYVITEACIGVKDATCVDVCPAACIHTTPDAPQYYIDPDVCIACEQCVLVCPVKAIYLDDDVPEHVQSYIEINAAFFRENKAPAASLTPVQADAIIAAAQSYADEAGLAVAIAVVGIDGTAIATRAAAGIEAATVASALDKAYTAASLQIATHQIRGAGSAGIQTPAGFDATRLVQQAGGYPAMPDGSVIGAIGIAGGASPQDDLLCCMAGLAALRSPRH